MGLDIHISRAKKKYCPHCGKEIGYEIISTESSSGRIWYDWLKEISYYVPYDERTKDNDWYGKDMVLTNEQIESMYKFLGLYTPYNDDSVAGLIARAMLEKNNVVINANW